MTDFLQGLARGALQRESNRGVPGAVRPALPARFEIATSLGPNAPVMELDSETRQSAPEGNREGPARPEEALASPQLSAESDAAEQLHMRRSAAVATKTASSDNERRNTEAAESRVAAPPEVSPKAQRQQAAAMRRAGATNLTVVTEQRETDAVSSLEPVTTHMLSPRTSDVPSERAEFTDVSQQRAVSGPLSDSALAAVTKPLRESKPVVYVTIDRLEVRAAAAPAPVKRAIRDKPAPSRSLGDYLRGRDAPGSGST